MSKTTSASEFLEQLTTLNRDKLLQVKGLGEVLVDNLIEFTKSERYATLVDKFKTLEQTNKGVTIEQKNSLNTNQQLPLNAVIVCITGTFEIPRETIKMQLEQLGATVSGSVSKKTTYLLAGQEAGSKREKAEEMGVLVLENLDILQPDWIKI